MGNNDRSARWADEDEVPVRNGNFSAVSQVKHKRRKRLGIVQTSDLLGCHVSYPTDPSICSSISRFISTAYSIGSSFTNGSINPLTIIVLASASERPRLIK